jgi:hypothetical protein
MFDVETFYVSWPAGIGLSRWLSFEIATQFNAPGRTLSRRPSSLSISRGAHMRDPTVCRGAAWAKPFHRGLARSHRAF